MSIINATRLLESHEIAQQRPNRSIMLASSPVVFFFILHFAFHQFLYVQDDAASRRFFSTLSEIVSRKHRNDATIAQKIACKQSHVYIKRWIYIFRYNLIYVKGFYL